MHKYWLEKNVNGKCHLIRESNNIRSDVGGSSEVVGQVLSESSRLPSAAQCIILTDTSTVIHYHFHFISEDGNLPC